MPTETGELLVEEASPEALAAGDLDLCFFSVGTAASRELVPHAVRGGAVCIDKSDAYRLTDGVPLVVVGVNDDVARRGRDRRQSELLGHAALLRPASRSTRLPASPACAWPPTSRPRAPGTPASSG